MSTIKQLYSSSLALLTDLYGLTMAYSYWQSGRSEEEAVFHLYFRKKPFEGGFAVACGLHYTIDLLSGFRFSADDLSFLTTVTGNDRKRLFPDDFLAYLKDMTFSCSINAVPEGTVVFPNEPLLRIQGPIIQCQLLETILLNIWNYQSLIATKAARIRQSAGNNTVCEFGARRAQGLDGALSASWAAHIGGCDSTSNVLAAKLFAIPVSGTHAHSWVMCFDQELEAFKAYANALPNNCIFLVDTYDTIGGVKHAIEVGKWLKNNGHEMVGIRLDSGDLAYLSVEARRLLDDAGFHKAKIIASNDLDENIIASLNEQGAAINIWAVGTKLITAYDQPALGCVYKLAAIRSKGGEWRYKIKLSEQRSKTSTPGIQQIRRFLHGDKYIGDGIFNELDPPEGDFVIVDPLDRTRRKTVSQEEKHQDLLKKIFVEGKLVYEQPPRTAIKEYVSEQLSRLHPSIRRLLNPHEYPVGLEKKLQELKTRLIFQARGLE